MLKVKKAKPALEQGGKGGREAQGSAAQQTKQILCKGSLVFFGGGFPGIFEVFEVNKHTIYLPSLH